MKTLRLLAIVLFIFGGILLAVTYGFFPIFVSHGGLPSLPTAFPYPFACFLGMLTTSLFVAGIALLIISHNKSNE